MNWKKYIGRDLLAVWVLATTALCGGLLINQTRGQPLPLVYGSKQARMDAAVESMAPARTTLPAKTAREPIAIGLEELKLLVESENALILDARPEIFHRLGHIPGAVSLPREAFEQEYAKLRTMLEAKRDQPIVVYCSNSGCEDSEMVANSLAKLDYAKVFIFRGGWSEWTNNGLPEEHS